MILIEHILRIVVFIKKSKGYMRFYILVATYIFRRNTVVNQKLANNIPHMVAPNISHHCTIHTSTTERHDTIERRTTWNCLKRLVVLEQNVQHGLPYSNHAFFTHNYSFSTKLSGNATFSNFFALANNGAISSSLKPAIPQPIRVT